MPTHHHPPAPHLKLQPDSGFVSGLMMERALEAVLTGKRKLDRTHDIPYLAGYSRDAKTIYIDRHLPHTFQWKGRRIETDQFLILHEEIEKTLIDHLGLHYLHAHQIALRAEQAAVRAQGVGWREYDRFMQRYIKEAADERLTNIPADLDTKPYREEHDIDLLRRMALAVKQGKTPRGTDNSGLLGEIEETSVALKEQAKRGPGGRRK